VNALTGLKAIETTYNGYRFRSRLEARWAVFFDALGMKYQYEPEGFDLGAAGRYLPDFWLETVSMWAEVKPRSLSLEEQNKCIALAEQSEFPVLLLIGPPEFKPYDAYERWPRGHGKAFKIDYLMTDEYFSEHRLFCGPGQWDDEVRDAWVLSERDQRAYLAARGARFEHGEHGR
jgi:hypothetical protein